jgi:paraquat-inducible protein A
MSAIVFLIPANIYPVMTVTTLGRGAPDTIISGVIKLMDSGLWGLAIIVLVASIVVPFLKIAVLCYLLISVHKQSTWRPGDRTRLFRITEVVGAWSMVDVFLVGLLAGLVKLGLVATIEPGIGATFFAGAVILTMLAAHNFDPRIIWDRALGTIHNLDSDSGLKTDDKNSSHIQVVN